jgi:CRISPR-associated protein Csx17
MKSMNRNSDDIDWSKATWEGARREELRRWRRLSLYEKLAAVEEMGDLAEQFATARAKRGLRSIRPN